MYRYAADFLIPFGLEFLSNLPFAHSLIDPHWTACWRPKCWCTPINKGIYVLRKMRINIQNGRPAAAYLTLPIPPVHSFGWIL